MLNKLRLISNNVKPLQSRLYSINSKDIKSIVRGQEPKITVTNDTTTIVCWHSEEPFPYQHSRPIPEESDTLKEDESVLKIEHRVSGQNIYKGLGPNTEELQMLTFTPKTFWTYRKAKRVIPKPPHPRKGV